jgi:hypothetical protein
VFGSIVRFSPVIWEVHGVRTRAVRPLLLACSFLFLTFAPAHATGRGGLATPDLAIKKLESSTYVGAGVVAPDGSGETAARSIRQGHTGSFDVRLPNPSAGTLSATLKGCRPDTGFQVRYFLGKTEVSKPMKAGTLTVTLAPGASLVIRVDVIVGDRTHAGRVQNCPVNALQSDTVVDTVIGQSTVRS